MSKLFSRNMLLYYAVPHSLIRGNNSLKARQIDGCAVSGWHESMLLRNARCSLNDTATCNWGQHSYLVFRGLRVRLSMRISCILTEVLLWDVRFWRLRLSKFWIFWQGALWNVVDRCQRVGGTRCPLLQDRSYNIKSLLIRRRLGAGSFLDVVDGKWHSALSRSWTQIHPSSSS